MRLFKRKENKVLGSKCEYSSAEDCPYTSEKECKFDKDRCLLLAKKNVRKKTYNYKSLYLWGIIGLLMFFSSTSFSILCSFCGSIFVFPIFSAIVLSLLTGSILAILIDLPSRLKDYEISFINALSSNNYLKSLEESKLTTLRSQITEQLHKTKAPHMASGLIKIDQDICELLRKPYYSRYRHIVCCKSIDENFMEKEHSIEYKLVNPYGPFQKGVENIKLTNHVVLNEGNDSEKPIKELKVSVYVDNEETPITIKESDIKITQEDIPNSKEFYNKKFIYNIYKAVFNDNIRVKINYKIKVPFSDDPCFTKRLQHPAKNFRLDYSCEDNNMILHGQIFGTQLKQSDVSIKYLTNGKNAISLETFGWLLPDNGAIVVMLK